MVFLRSSHATTLDRTSLPHKGYEALGMLLVLWILRGKEFEHDLLLLFHAQSEGDGDEDKHADTEDTGRECGSKCRKHDARIDRMAHGSKDDDSRSSQPQHPKHPKSLPATTTHVLLHKEGAYTPHQKKRRPAHEDDGIVGNHCRRTELPVITTSRYIRCYEAGKGIVAPSCL